jgi:thiol-disulfide isomerase/thioredoxin
MLQAMNSMKCGFSHRNWKDGVMRSQNEVTTRLLFAVCVAALLSIPASSVLIEAADVTVGELEQSAATPADGGGEQAAEKATVDPDSQIVVYYFHGARRCKTCRTIEAYAEEVVKSRFAKELESGSMAWEVVNYDEAENEHFLKEFGLVSASLVVVEMSKGKPVRFEVLQKAWSLVRDKPGFDQYVHRSLLDYMG